VCPRSRRFVGGSGNDTISGFQRIQGGAGNDILTPGARAEGGDGNDTLIANSSQRVDLRGEAGDDTLQFFTGATVSGGSGNDHFIFEAVAATTINDLSAGDVIDLSALLDGSVSDAFAQGYLTSTISKGYTYCSIDRDGGGDDYTLLVTLKGQFTDISSFLSI